MEILKEVLDGKAELIRKIVRNHRCSGAVYLPKKYIGKEVIIIVRNDEKNTNPVVVTA